MPMEDHSGEVKEKIEDAVISFLHEAAGELEAQYKKNSRVDTGKTKGGISYKVDEAKKEAYIGGDTMNHIWEEFGTGEYALQGNGRKGGWYYRDPKTGKLVFTTGKRPSRAFYYAYQQLPGPIIQRAQMVLKGLK